ncbi:MAG TPA: SxtJ family membrane protein, partial [Afifellaceae bacterium]|nr:SxtJ family membrane protein [Afifellaceae bacterium]
MTSPHGTAAVTERDLRKFGLAVGGIFCGIAAWILIRRHGESWPGFFFAMLGATLVLFGALLPRALAGPHRVWMFLALILGWINTRLILGA